MTRRWITVALLGALACGEEEVPPVYQVTTVASRDIVLSARADGVVEPIKTVEIKSKASGEITAIAADVGDEVQRGQLLVRVDQRTPRNTLIQAEADSAAAQARLETAERKLTRSATLYQAESITEEDFEAANLERANAYAALVRARRNLEDARIAFEDTEVRAASKGVILTRSVEVGTVIASAVGAVSGGAVLMTMANLDTVQVRTLVSELDIGKIQPGMDVSIYVDAYADRVFPAQVLKIEPEAVDDEGKTMFPVLIWIPNEEGLLKQGMNTKVEIHIGQRQQVASIPNAALRSRSDLSTAASVIGIAEEEIVEQLNEAARIASGDTAPPAEAAELPDDKFQFRGQTYDVPAGFTKSQIEDVLGKLQGGGGFQGLSSEDRAIMGAVFRAIGGPGGQRGGGRGARRGGRSSSSFQFGGTFVVFAVENGAIVPREIRTGLTDLEFSEVTEGLAPGDSILLLPSSSLVQSQQQLQERIARFSGGIPGVSTGGRGRR